MTYRDERARAKAQGDAYVGGDGLSREEVEAAFDAGFQFMQRLVITCLPVPVPVRVPRSPGRFPSLSSHTRTNRD